MKHICHAKKCTQEVPPKMFMCNKHWFMLPKQLRDLVWKVYVPGQEIRKDPTPEYLKISNFSIDYIALMEEFNK